MNTGFHAGQHLAPGDPGDDAAFSEQHDEATDAHCSDDSGPVLPDGVVSDHTTLDPLQGSRRRGFGPQLHDEPSPHISVFGAEARSEATFESPTTFDGNAIDLLNSVDVFHEKEILPDTRRFLSENEVRSFPYSAVCLIRATFRDGTFTGTGVLATPNMVVTAAHNLVRSQRASSVQLIFGAHPQGSVATRAANRIEIHPRYRSSVDPPEVDYGAVFFSQAVTETKYVRFFPITDPQTYRAIRNNIEVPGYPKLNGTAGVMYTSRNRIHDVLVSGRIEHQVDTSPGQSGAPLLGWFPQASGPAVPAVIGIHNQSDTSSLPLNYGAFVNQDMIKRLLVWKNA